MRGGGGKPIKTLKAVDIGKVYGQVVIMHNESKLRPSVANGESQFEPLIELSLQSKAPLAERSARKEHCS